MGKYGTKKTIASTVFDYMHILIGEAGIGKTTIFKNILQKHLGDDGYMFLEMGKEHGDEAIEGIVSESVEDWNKLIAVVGDIIKNKETDYKNLKVIVFDTLDQFFDVTAKNSIKVWNSDNIGTKDFKPAKTLNQSWGGFQKGNEYTTNTMLDIIWKLKEVGVTCWLIGHTKSRDITDPVTNSTYTSLTTDMSQKDFNQFKNKAPIVAVAYIDRDVQTEKTGRKDIKKNDITINRVTNETRKISFRDVDNYAVDSKSRFAHIVNEIPLDADAYVKAVQDAIDAEKVLNAQNTPAVEAPVNTEEKKPKKQTKKTVEETVAEEAPVDIDTLTDKTYPDNLLEAISKGFTSAPDDVKNAIKNYVMTAKTSLPLMTTEQLKEVYDILTR
jgi:GTPase SAR1 family protein